MYVTLEPCSHHGRTPPCANAIIAAGMRRVVCAIEDPNPEISGRGLAVLRNAGVAVDLGLCAEEARWMAAGHILRMTRDRPFVQLKIAVSGDGLIAPGDGAPRWVTGRRPVSSRTSCARAPMPSWSAARRLPTTIPSSPAACRAWKPARRGASFSTPSFARRRTPGCSRRPSACR